jgi:prepilin-type N-terminal cleavage/methylation domain-containing protein
MPTSTRTRPFEAPAGDRSRPAASASEAARGFTLLELSVVLLILAIATGFVIPRLRNTDRAALESGAARLATTARYLYEEAAFRHRPMRLNLDLDQQTYWVTVLSDDPDRPDEFVPDDSPLARPTALPGSVVFADVVLPAFGILREGTVFAQFFPEGYADPLVVHLANARHEYATMAIEPLTGRTRVATAYVELDAGAVADARDRSRDDASGIEAAAPMRARMERRARVPQSEP